MSKEFSFEHLSLAEVRTLRVKTVLFEAIQFSISTKFSSIGAIVWTLSGATISRQNWPWSDSNEEVLCILQNSRVTGSLPSDFVVSYLGHSLEGSYLSAKKKRSVYSPAPAKWATKLNG